MRRGGGLERVELLLAPPAARGGGLRASPSRPATAASGPGAPTDTGFEVGTFDADPAVRTQQGALLALTLNEDNRLAQAFLDRRGELDEAWLRVSGQHGYTLALTPEQLRGLRDAIDALLRPHIAGAELPPGTRRVHVGVRAFPR